MKYPLKIPLKKKNFANSPGSDPNMDRDNKYDLVYSECINHYSEIE
jgi:hypothetical protein